VDVNPDIKRLEIEVSEKLGAKLSIEHKARGSGKIVINYNDLDELEGILDHIK
jgi:ParB family chromosome partitioning protein